MTLLIGYDGSDGGRDALELGRVLAEAMGAGVLVNTVLPYGPLPIPYVMLEEEDRADADRECRRRPPPRCPLRSDRRAAPQAGAIVTRTVKTVDERLAATGRELSGVPGPAIIEACEGDGTDLLVAGSRGYGPVRRVLLGSVSTHLAHHAPCPVLVVPRP